MIFPDLVEVAPNHETKIPRGKALSTRGLREHASELDLQRVGGFWPTVMELGPTGDPKNPLTPDFGYDASWRKALTEYLNSLGITIIDPKVEGWIPEDAYGEVEGCKNSAVILFCFDADTVSKSEESFNTGLASLAELNAMMALSVLNGRKMVVSFCPEYFIKITDPVVRDYLNQTLENIQYYEEHFPQFIRYIKSESKEFTKARVAAVAAMQEHLDPNLRPPKLERGKVPAEESSEQKPIWITKDQPQLVEYAQLGKKLFLLAAAERSPAQKDEVVLILDEVFNPDEYVAAHFSDEESLLSLERQLDQVLDDVVQMKRILPLSEDEKKEFKAFMEEDIAGIYDESRETPIKVWHQNRVKKLFGTDEVSGKSSALYSSAKEIIGKIKEGSTSGIFKQLKSHPLLMYCHTVLHCVNVNRGRDIGRKQFVDLKERARDAAFDSQNGLVIIADSLSHLIDQIEAVDTPEQIVSILNQLDSFYESMVLDEVSFGQIKEARHGLIARLEKKKAAVSYNPEKGNRAERIELINRFRLKRLQAKGVEVTSFKDKNLTDEKVRVELLQLEYESGKKSAEN